jgi:hypothetical protein
VMRWLKRLFTGRRTIDRETEEILHAYGRVLQQRAMTQVGLMDVRELPHPKERIKTAIIAGLRVTEDARMQEMLRAGYVHLAGWQEGVGCRVCGMELPNRDPESDPTEQAERLLEGGPGFDKWQAAVQAEQEALRQELRDLGFWGEESQ